MRKNYGRTDMNSIYRNENAKNAVLELYDRQLEELGITFRDIYVETSFGRTHLIECGDMDKKPLLVFHGGNATTAYNLKYCDFLLPHFHVYAVDTIGHPGKSAEVSLSPYNQDYGKWAGEVIRLLGYEKMACFGGSFGAGVLVKTMCAAPATVERSVLLVPSAIKNALSIKSMNMMFPMIMYYITHKEKWFRKCLLPMAVDEKNISEDILITARCSIDNAKIKSIMPQDEKESEMKKYRSPVLVMAAEKDCLFPAHKVLPRARRVWEQCDTYLLEGRGHMNKLTENEKDLIVEFLKK
ncbi:MAG: alpha/beta fold hydrolase [Huintestinicola sp.]|uniref:alpha/beta fold hydrolase n=1 Tax=Huintestinicola sp. TaxID=2981661 RepID=UPI003F01A05E